MNEYLKAGITGAVRNLFTAVPVFLFLMLVCHWHMLWAMAAGMAADSVIAAAYGALKRRRKGRSA